MRYKILNQKGRAGDWFQFLCLENGERIPGQLESVVTQTLRGTKAVIKAHITTDGVVFSPPCLRIFRGYIWLDRGDISTHIACDILEHYPGNAKKGEPGYVVFSVDDVITPAE